MLKRQAEGVTKTSRKTLAGVLAMLAAVGLFTYIFIWPHIDLGSSTKEQPLPAAQRQDTELRPTDLQAFINTHGPWLTMQESELLRQQTGVRNLALFRSNGLMYSAQSVRFEPSSTWTPATNPPQIKGVDVRGAMVEIETTSRNRYILNASQPFMLEGNLTRVFVVDRDRKLWSAPVANLTFVPATDTVDPSIPANPEMTISVGSN